MKNIYATLLTGTALLLAGVADAQSINSPKTNHQASPAKLTAPGVVAHDVVPTAARGVLPPNDGCGTVTFEALSIDGSLTFTGDNTGATEDGDFEAGSGLEGFGPCVWHGFTTTECANITVAYCGTTPVFGNLGAFFARTCPATDADYITYTSGNFTDCADLNGTITWLDVPAGSYYLPVLMDLAAPAVGPYTILVSAVACIAPPDPPANDDCANAIPIDVDTWCNFQYFTGAGGTESLPAITCNTFTGDAGDDVWFSFVATATDIAIGAQGADDGDGNPNTGYDAVIELFSGACGAGTSLGCADATLGNEPEEIAATGLTVGATYYVRVYDWYANPWPNHTFGFCVVEGGGINIGMEEHSNVADWSIFPNPGTGVFNLQYSGANELATIDVIDVTGRVVYTERTSLGTNHTMDLSGLSTGNYGVRLTMNGVSTEQRLMVQ
ncbi:MAG: T9SS type A sorting domain-containing protein [Flavobacteriales bacterium]